MNIKHIAAGITAAVIMGAMSVTAFAAQKESPLQMAAYAIDDSLSTAWGENRNVSYTEDENKIYIIIWDDGVNEKTIENVNNWDAVRDDKIKMFNAYYTVFDQVGIKDGHMSLQYTDEAKQFSFLTIEDGKVVNDYVKNKEMMKTKEALGYLDASSQEQMKMIAKQIGSTPDHLFFVTKGTLNQTENVAYYGYKDQEGNEADIRLVFFDDGHVIGLNPDNTVLDVTNYFKEN